MPNRRQRQTWKGITITRKTNREHKGSRMSYQKGSIKTELITTYIKERRKNNLQEKVERKEILGNTRKCWRILEKNMKKDRKCEDMENNEALWRNCVTREMY